MADYSTYSIEELAADPYFCRWVLYPDAETKAFWEQRQNADLKEAEKIVQARQLVLAVQIKETEVPDEKVAQMWANLQMQIDEAEAGAAKIRTLSSKSWYIAIAASVILLVGLFFIILRPQSVTHIAAKGERQQFFLPDSSEVILNADSKLVYDVKKWEEDRVVELSGEGFFEVKKGSTFRVETAMGDVEVLGTSFNVLARKEQFKVECFTGKVAVTRKEVKVNESPTLLIPGEAVEQQEEGGLAKENFEVAVHEDWRVGIFHYEDEEVKYVFEEIARQFDRQLRLEVGLEGRDFSGKFTNKNLDSTLHQVCWPLSLEYKYEGNTIVVKSKK